MNLYKVLSSHHSPKDRHRAISALLLADNEEQVFDWIASEPETKEESLFNSWSEQEEEEGYNDEDDKPENFKERMLRLKGQMHDDSFDFSDAYYGITLFGWELLKENVTHDYSELIELGIVFNVTQ